MKKLILLFAFLGLMMPRMTVQADDQTKQHLVVHHFLLLVSRIIHFIYNMRKLLFIFAAMLTVSARKTANSKAQVAPSASSRM